MQFTHDDLDNLSRLARIDIAPAEKEKMLHDMQAILSYISELSSVTLEKTFIPPEIVNVTREDVVLTETGSLTEAILSNAPHREGDYVKVTQVLK